MNYLQFIFSISPPFLIPAYAILFCTMEYIDISYSYNKIFQILGGCDDEIKPFAVLELEIVHNEEDFELLMRHLTNCDGRLREVVSSKLVELAPCIWLKSYTTTLLDALCDVNPNVSRNIIELISKAQFDLAEPLLGRIEELLDIIEKKSKPKKWRTQKNHELTKIFFQLYWCLEALALFADTAHRERLVDILNKTSDFVDYTIREKTAKILAKMQDPPEEMLRKMQNDENFFVKMCFCDNI